MKTNDLTMLNQLRDLLPSDCAMGHAESFGLGLTGIYVWANNLVLIAHVGGTHLGWNEEEWVTECVEIEADDPSPDVYVHKDYYEALGWMVASYMRITAIK